MLQSRRLLSVRLFLVVRARKWGSVHVADPAQSLMDLREAHLCVCVCVEAEVRRRAREPR